MPVLPPTAEKWKKRRRLWLLLFVVLFGIGLAWLIWFKLFREVPQEFASDAAYFKYGSIGTENDAGIPYWIWVVLPRVFPEYLPAPGGYSSLGLVWEPGEEMPVGFSKKRIGFDRVAFNCALCHSATFRTAANSNTTIVPAGPASRLDPQGYLGFLSQCAEDSRFNSATLLEAIEYNVKLSWIDRQLYKLLIVPRTRKAIKEQAERAEWMRSRPIWGRGRIDPFNPVKFGMLGMDPSKDDTVGNSDMMPVWTMSARKSHGGESHLHWDGLSTNFLECSLAGALGDGATKKSLPVERIRKLVSWLETYDPVPPYPLGQDADLARDGKAVFERQCAQCHGPDGEWTNRPVPLTTIGTDANRLRMWNPEPLRDPPHPADRYNAFGDGYSWDLNGFVKTNGYVAPPLNGVWLRAPYLHNGSVPTLEDLLNPSMPESQVANFMNGAEPGSFERLQQLFSRAEFPSVPAQQLERQLDELKPAVDALIQAARALGRRPPLFYRGYDVLDPNRVGFVHSSEAAVGRRLPPFVTFVRGNSNHGHEGPQFGTDLSREDKRALVEYLKGL